MKRITSEMVDEIGDFNFWTEASTVGLNPGEWPAMMLTSMGNGLPLVRRTKKLKADGELEYVRYIQSSGCISVKISND
jgi:hypothetical protein